MKYTHILWDWNGTLLDDVMISIDCVNVLLKKMNKAEKEKLIASLTSEMREAAKMLEFEHAAYLRDRIAKLREGKQ